jgi:hypothetical protein
MAIALNHPAQPATAVPAPRTHRRDFWPTLGVSVVWVLFGFLVAGRIATVLITRTINDRLAGMREYSGHAARIQVAWWRGRVTVRHLEIWPRGHETEDPVAQLDQGSVSITASALWRGRLGLRALLDGADVTMLKTGTPQRPARTAAEKEAGNQRRLAEIRHWQAALHDAFPLELARLEITNSRVRFVDQTVAPNPEMVIDHLHLVVNGLGEKPKSAEDLPAQAQLTGALSGDGRLVASIQADPAAKQPRFRARVEVSGLSLPSVANFMRAYARIEVTKGTFEVLMEATAAAGRYEGYMKPVFHDLAFTPVRAEQPGFFKRIAIRAAGVFTALVKNAGQKISPQAPFQGEFAEREVDVWTSVENLFRNVFVQSLGAGLEQRRPTH